MHASRHCYSLFVVYAARAAALLLSACSPSLPLLSSRFFGSVHRGRFFFPLLRMMRSAPVRCVIPPAGLSPARASRTSVFPLRQTPPLRAASSLPRPLFASRASCLLSACAPSYRTDADSGLRDIGLRGRLALSFSGRPEFPLFIFVAGPGDVDMLYHMPVVWPPYRPSIRAGMAVPS